ncbi:MAG: Gldg family protein [Pseudohongiellaceae bacterium]
MGKYSLKPLWSTTGLLAIALSLVLLVALISTLPGYRVDLTEDRLYSLSEGTRNIVSNLEQPVELMFFYSDAATADVPQIRSYATRVTELLEEIVIASDGNLSLEVIDPQPFSEEEDLATQFAIQAVPVTQGGEAVYFGLVAAQTRPADNGGRIFETIPLIRPDQEEFLEYEFAKLITQVANPERQVIGLITELDIDGGFNPSVGQATPPWMVMDIARQLYEIRRIPGDTVQIQEDVEILVVVHPYELSEQTLYAIDQHVLRSGKAIVFLDPNADSLISSSNFGTTIPANVGSDMPRLLRAWGVEYDDDKVLTDSDFALRVMMGQNQQPVAHLGMLGVQRAGLTLDDIVTNSLESINLSSAGAISPVEGATTTFEPLIRSSSNAMLMDAGLVQDVSDPSILFDEFESADQRFTIAARVSGPVATAFPEGRPEPEESAAIDPEEIEETDGGIVNDDVIGTDVAGPSDDAEATEVEQPAEHINASIGPVNLVVVADTDILTDRLWVQVSQFLGQRIPQPFANNGDFFVNSLDNLSGGADLVSIRSRGRYSRPFTRVLDLQRAADDRLRAEEAELLENLAATEEAMAELSQNDAGQPIAQLTPEQQAEVDRFNEELLQTRRRLRDVQHQLNEDIEQLGATLKWVNVAGVPVLLTVVLLAAGFLRTRRRSRQAAG